MAVCPACSTRRATAKKVPGGFRVTGTWHYNSAGWHAQWAVLGMPIVNDAGETIDQGLALIPMTDLERVDTWFVAGMKSSGSICLKANDAFIPDHRILSMPPRDRRRLSDGDARPGGLLSIGVRSDPFDHPGGTASRPRPRGTGIRPAKGRIAHDRLYLLREADIIGRASSSRSRKRR